MKAKKVLLFLSASLLLSGCGVGKIKTPKNLVTYETFIDEIKSLKENNSLFVYETGMSMYSYTVDLEEEMESTTEVYVGGNKIEETERKREYSEELEYDSSSKVVHAEIEGKETEESDEEESTQKRKSEVYMQTGTGNIAIINKVKKIYCLTEWENPISRMDYAASRGVASALSLFTSEIYQSSKLYIDGNVYTIVNEKTIGEVGDTRVEKNQYQLTIEADGFTLTGNEYERETITSDSQVKYYTYEHKATLEVERDDVSVKPITIGSGYSEVKNVSIDSLLF